MNENDNNESIDQTILDQIILVGCKKDDKRKVSYSNAVSTALEIGVTYIETSSTTNENIEDLFSEALSYCDGRISKVGRYSEVFDKDPELTMYI
jgi:GTPase SAR1 family protein